MPRVNARGGGGRGGNGNRRGRGRPRKAMENKKANAVALKRFLVDD